MAKKKLLSEKQVRRFMGLAGIKPLNEMAHGYKRDEEEMEEAMHSNLEEEEAMDDMPEEEPMGDMPEEEPKELEGPVGGEADKEEMAADVIKAVADALGVEIDIDMDDKGEEMEMDMEDEKPMDDMPDMDDEEDDMDDEELMKEMSDVGIELTEDEIVNEVARRVARRIVEAKRAQKRMNEALGKKTRPGSMRKRK
jgi:hypothetical protein